jgi:hypothetical protein
MKRRRGCWRCPPSWSGLKAREVEVALEEIDNHVEDRGDETRVYCVNCGDPESGTGWAPSEMVMAMNWKRSGDALLCSARCAAEYTGSDVDAAVAADVRQEVLSEEQVAALSGPAQVAELDIDALDEFSGGEG